MNKSILSSSNNNTLIKKANLDRQIKINSKYFSIKFVPYNKILNNLLIYLKKKLSPSIFNEIYKYFTNEIIKYLKKNIASNKIINNESFNKNPTDILNKGNNKRVISEFCFKNYENDKFKSLFKNKTKVNLKKHIQPFINLPFNPKYRNNFLKTREISSFSKNINSKNASNNISLLDDKDISFILAENNYTINHIGKGNNIKKNNTNNNSTTNTKQTKNKFKNIFLSNNLNYNTINTSIHKNEKNKASNVNKTKNFSKKEKIENPQTFKTLPNHQFPIPQKVNNKKFNTNKTRVNSDLKDIKNIKNAVVINNTFFNKYKNNYNFRLSSDDQKKIKIVNFKLKDKDKKGNMRILTPVLNSDEMLDKIKKSLDDDNLKVMLNFSYENFLSKESERESKEYSIGD